MTSTEKIAKNIREIRKSKRFTQLEVAEKAKISTNHYAKIERGEVAISVSTLERIVKSLDVKSSEVLSF